MGTTRDDRRHAGDRSGRLRWLNSVGRMVIAAPVSLTFGVCVLLGAALSGLATAGWAASAEATLSEGKWWTPVTAIVVPSDIPSLILCVALALTALVFAERVLGGTRLVIALLGGGVATVITAVLVESGLARWSGLESVADDAIIAPSIAVTVAIMAASAGAGVLWRRRIRVVTVASVVLFALYAADPASWTRVIALVIGAVLGRFWFGTADGRVLWRSTIDERRTLVAGFVALTGLGPVAALVTGGGRGPLAAAAAQFSDVDTRLAAHCAATSSPICDHQTAMLLTRGVGPALLAAVPLVLLVLAAWGLRSGRRAAWLLALGTSGVLAAAGGAVAATGAVVLAGSGGGAVVEGLLWGAASIGLPLAVVVTLLLTRRAFTVRVRRDVAARAWLVIAGSFVMLASVYLAAEYLLRASWARQPTAGQAAWEALRRFLPPVLLYDAGQPPFPHHGAALLVWQWVGVVFWIIVVAAIVQSFASSAAEGTTDRERVISALHAGDGGTLAWLGTWAGVRHWFAGDGVSAVSYRVVSGVALVVSDPICSPERRPQVVREFIAFADERGWIPVFYSVHESTTVILRDLGWSDMPVAEETVIRPQAWTMAGKAGEKVRHPVTRMQREGVTALWTTWADLAPTHGAAIREISEEWVSEKALPEMGFTLGGIAEMQDPEVRLLLALAADGSVLGVTSWLPSWRGGERSGWTLDVMRRAPGAPNGVMEFLIASAALQMKDDGIDVLSLSGAPLAMSDADSDEQSTVIRTVLARLADALEPLYGFASLFRFKAKFRPEHHTLSMSYADPLQLGVIGLAVMRAYLPFASRAEVLALARGFREREGHR